jgi:hypothetical protein
MEQAIKNHKIIMLRLGPFKWPYITYRKHFYNCVWRSLTVAATNTKLTNYNLKANEFNVNAMSNVATYSYTDSNISGNKTTN